MPRRRHPNPRLVKIHRNYTVEEVARVLHNHKNTVRAWLKQGLPMIDRRRPTLIYGCDLRHFLETRRKQAKRPCPPGHIYCVKCRAPKAPAGNMTEYVPITTTLGILRAICPNCETLIHRRVSLARIDTMRGDLEITFPKAGLRIRERTVPSVDCDSGKDSATDENA